MDDNDTETGEYGDGIDYTAEHIPSSAYAPVKSNDAEGGPGDDGEAYTAPAKSKAKPRAWPKPGGSDRLDISEKTSPQKPRRVDLVDGGGGDAKEGSTEPSDFDVEEPGSSSSSSSSSSSTSRSGSSLPPLKPARGAPPSHAAPYVKPAMPSTMPSGSTPSKEVLMLAQKARYWASRKEELSLKAGSAEAVADAGAQAGAGAGTGAGTGTGAGAVEGARRGSRDSSGDGGQSRGNGSGTAC